MSILNIQLVENKKGEKLLYYIDSDGIIVRTQKVDADKKPLPLSAEEEKAVLWSGVERDLIMDAFAQLPEEVRDSLLFRGAEICTGAKLVANFQPNGKAKTTGQRIVQFLTYMGSEHKMVDGEEKEYAIEKGVVWMPEGSAILPHKHETDSECYQEVTKGGFILDGKPREFVVCKSGEEHSAEAAPKGGACIAWEWHENGKNLDFAPQDFAQTSEQKVAGLR